MKYSCSFLTKANLKTQTKKQNIKLPLSSHQYSSLSTKFYHLEITRSFALHQSFSAKSSVSRVMWRTRSIIYPAPQTELSKILLFSSHTSLLFDLIIISLQFSKGLCPMSQYAEDISNRLANSFPPFLHSTTFCKIFYISRLNVSAKVWQTPGSNKFLTHLTKTTNVFQTYIST